MQEDELYDDDDCTSIESIATPSVSAFDHVLSQGQSFLFRLPAEVRDLIYDHALAPFEDRDQRYKEGNIFVRPGYRAIRKSDLRLLRTCKRAYNEAAAKPWALADWTFWLTTIDRAPDHSMTKYAFKRILKRRQWRGAAETEETDHVRCFAQMYMLEQTTELSSLLHLRAFNVRSVTITLRHTDWWWWENDEPLRFSCTVPEQISFPSSVRRVYLELESLDRKRAQIDSIVRQMKRWWYFRRDGGIWLSATRTPVGVERWEGSSTLGDRRWVRDETRPNCLSYCEFTHLFQRTRYDTDSLEKTSLPSSSRKKLTSFRISTALCPISKQRILEDYFAFNLQYW